jgi:hypothetical protein
VGAVAATGKDLDITVITRARPARSRGFKPDEIAYFEISPRQPAEAQRRARRQTRLQAPGFARPVPHAAQPMRPTQSACRRPTGARVHRASQRRAARDRNRRLWWPNPTRLGCPDERHGLAGVRASAAEAPADVSTEASLGLFALAIPLQFVEGRF